MDFQLENIVLLSIISFVIVENSIELYLSNRQVKVFLKRKNVPYQLKDVMQQETFDKARLYGLDKEVFSMFKVLLLDIAIASLELYFGFIVKMWNKSEELTEQMGFDKTNEIYVSCVFLILVNCINIVKDIPFKLYGTFILEEKHGFNKQTYDFFIKDQIKSFILVQILSLPIASAIIYIVRQGGEYFFVWLWLFTGVITLVLITIYPTFIAPLFDKYRPLDQGPLRTSIEDLAKQLKFPLGDLYVVEGSKRSAHSNAYFFGLLGTKRIVLFDTLLLNKGQTDLKELKTEEVGKGCEDAEVLAVLGHELGHWKLGHVTKNVIIMQVNLFLTFAVFGYLFKYDILYRSIGFEEGKQPILVGLMIIVLYVLAAYNAVISFAMTVLSRRYEYQADEFAKNLGFGELLGKALIKLHIDNLGFPFYDWMYSMWNHSHPTLLQRLEKLHDKKKN